MKALFTLIALLLVGCAAQPVATSSSKFTYPPPPDAPRSVDVTWPEMIVVIRGGHVTLAREARSLQVSIVTDDGRTYRTSEPEYRAIHEAIQQHAPNLRQISFEDE